MIIFYVYIELLKMVSRFFEKETCETGKLLELLLLKLTINIICMSIINIGVLDVGSCVTIYI